MVGRLSQLLDVLPRDTVEFACAYGSGAVSQSGEKTAGKMVDFIVASQNSSRFHELNLEQNPRHYSALRFLGHQRITRLQRNYAARVYCNTRISLRVS
ncbi:unnamed protein product [Gongylonema pulchrum]|uniref:Phosphatidate cytidylyltransferase, mitochondrial n=1 Tax=Gongylonema pulchrum TaxID=637853 RepID=A0A183E9Q1_9BILA|nr:unnamed protein product [Gongylonema pulchrum]